MYECALCLIVLRDEEAEQAIIDWAFDRENSGTKRWVCKNRISCNERRFKRILAAAGASK